MLKTLFTSLSYALWFTVSLFFIVAPFTLLSQVLPALFQIILFAFGISWLVLLAFVSMYSRYYVKVGTDEALMRTGAGPELLIIDGGTIVIPLFHKLIRVSLRTDVVHVSREGKDALITADSLPANLRAEFFIRVQKIEEDIKNAAKALGERTSVEAMEDFRTLFEGAMSEVVAQFDLMDLHRNRQKFTVEVKESANVILPVYGYTLEEVKITYLAPASLDEANMTGVFKGNASAQEEQMTAGALEVETSAKQRKIELETELNRTRQQTEGEKTEQETMVIKARRNREFARIEAEQAKAIRQKLSDVAVARQEVINAEEVAKREIEKEEAVQIEGIARDQRVELRQIEKEMAVIDREKGKEESLGELAWWQGERLKKQADREREAQQLKTVEAVQAQEREKKKTVIAAEAELEAARKEAEGQKAKAFVPVEVEGKRIEVRRKELSQNEEYATAALAFELKKAGIQLDAEVRKAFAAALGEMMGNTKVTLFGDSEMATRMGERFMSAAGAGIQVGGFLSGVMSDDGIAEIGALFDRFKKLWPKAREGDGKEELLKALESFLSAERKDRATSQSEAHAPR